MTATQNEISSLRSHPSGRGLTSRPAPTITGGGTEAGGAEPIAKFHERYTVDSDWAGPADRLSPEEAAELQTYPTAPVLRNGNQANSAKRPLGAPAPTVHFGARSNKVEWMDPSLVDTPSASGERVTAEQTRITVEEAGALQSYPREPPFTFCGTKTKVMLQIGNAVPPLLATHILEALVHGTQEVAQQYELSRLRPSSNMATSLNDDNQEVEDGRTDG